jgi:hypothetical protein
LERGFSSTEILTHGNDIHHQAVFGMSHSLIHSKEGNTITSQLSLN